MVEEPDGTPNSKAIIVWDVATSEVVARFSNRTWDPLHVAFSPDGEWLLTSEKSGTLKLWPLGAIEFLRLACRRLQHQPEYTAMPDVASVCGGIGGIERSQAAK